MDWKQPIKIEMRPAKDGKYECYVLNEYNVYAVGGKLIDGDVFDREAQPIIDKLIKVLKQIAK